MVDMTTCVPFLSSEFGFTLWVEADNGGCQRTNLELGAIVMNASPKTSQAAETCSPEVRLSRRALNVARGVRKEAGDEQNMKR